MLTRGQKRLPVDATESHHNNLLLLQRALDRLMSEAKISVQGRAAY